MKKSKTLSTAAKPNRKIAIDANPGKRLQRNPLHSVLNSPRKDNFSSQTVNTANDKVKAVLQLEQT